MVKELFESNEFEIEKFEFEVKVEWMKWKYLKMTRNENIEEKKNWQIWTWNQNGMNRKERKWKEMKMFENWNLKINVKKWK